MAVPVTTALLFASADVGGQEVFRSTQSANLPTAYMLNSGNWMFEISHRFDNAISNGSRELWGLDGPVNNRLSLTFAPHDRLMLTVLRSNFRDNLELNARWRALLIDSESTPIEIGAQGGIAWNTDFLANDNEMQAYVQVMANALFAERVAVGVVPTFLRNPRILDVDTETAFVLGLHGQYYFNRTWSFLAEWILSESRVGLENDSGTFGFEIRTRGHHFKLLVTNQARMNPTQFLGGTPHDFSDPDVWRLGFNIQRLLPF